MPPLTDEQIRRRVIQQWVSGFPRDTIAAENNIGAGTVSSIVASYKVGLDNAEFDSIRQLSIEIRKQGLNWSDLSSHFRLYNYFLKSGAAEDKIESFISNINSGDASPDPVIELVNQLFDISKAESIPLDQVSGYINKKLEENKKIDEQIKSLNEAAETYGLTPTSAALDVINLIIDHSKKGQLKRELSELNLRKYAIERFCSSRSQIIMALMNLRGHGISEDRILYLNYLLEKNGYNVDMKSTVALG